VPVLFSYLYEAFKENLHFCYSESCFQTVYEKMEEKTNEKFGHVPNLRIEDLAFLLTYNGTENMISKHQNENENENENENKNENENENEKYISKHIPKKTDKPYSRSFPTRSDSSFFKPNNYTNSKSKLNDVVPNNARRNRFDNIKYKPKDRNKFSENNSNDKSTLGKEIKEQFSDENNGNDLIRARKRIFRTRKPKLEPIKNKK